MVRAAPFTMKCLESDEVGIGETNPNFSGCETAKDADHDAVSLSAGKGFAGKSMKVVSIKQHLRTNQ